MENSTLQLLDNVGKCAYSTFDTILNSYNSSLHVIENKIEGDYVECGVAAGSQIASMGIACKVKGEKRKIWAFDSFEGIPMACEKDDQQPGVQYFSEPLAFVEDKDSLLVSSKITVHPLQNVKNNLTSWQLDLNDFVFVKGWFQKTLPHTAEKIDKISILRLDGDLYESTKVCLDYLFPKLVSGGILIIDDWALKGCRVACDEYFGDYSMLGERNDIVGTTPVWFIKK